MKGKKPWKKVLYEYQPYPDNYTDKNLFLSNLRTNIKKIGLSEAIFGSTFLLQELCTVVLFLVIYIYLINEWIYPEYVLNISSVVTFIGFMFYRLETTKQSNFGHDLRTVLIFIVFGHLFSPVLHTLTDTVSTDTIYTMAFFMLLVHLTFFDYKIQYSSFLVSNSLSLSAAIFASICLASRLASPFHAFILITLAIEVFVLFPIFRNEIKNNSFLLTFILFILDSLFLWRISKLFFFLFNFLTIIINIICPFLFVKYQSFKMNIYGPWDEAIISI